MHGDKPDPAYIPVWKLYITDTKKQWQIRILLSETRKWIIWITFGNDPKRRWENIHFDEIVVGFQDYLAIPYNDKAGTTTTRCIFIGWLKMVFKCFLVEKEAKDIDSYGTDWQDLDQRAIWEQHNAHNTIEVEEICCKSPYTSFSCCVLWPFGDEEFQTFSHWPALFFYAFM